MSLLLAKEFTLNLEIGLFDTAIVLAYLAGVVAFGSWLGRGKQSLTDYLLGSKDLPWWTIMGSIVATETSTATFLSIPGITFAAAGDMRFLQLTFGYIIGRWLVSLVLLPLFFRGQMFTAYEVLNVRFGGKTKVGAAILFLVTRNLGDGLRLFLTAIVLQATIGLPLSVCAVVIGLLTIVYTYLGGMKSVVWNDCIQLVIYIAGGIIALVVILQRLPGGLNQLVSFAQENNKLRLFDLSFDLSEKYTLWAGLIGGAFLSLGTHGTDQMMVQRYLSARSQQDASRALVLSGFVVFGQFTLFLILGVALACYYGQFPPEQAFERGDSVFASFIVTRLPVGLTGITLAAVFAAAMSTLSSSLNSSATSAVNDLIGPWRKNPLPPELTLRLSRQLTIVFGLIQIGIGIGAQYFAQTIVEDVLAIAGFSAGVLLGLFLLGILTQKVGQTAALIGMFGGLLAVSYVKFNLDVAWPWHPVVGTAATLAFGLTASFVLRRATD